ncbi:hypothetical protein EYF80_031576 [Liparis tanakae]|uniref:Uncharacterized protein n=1 Tax=Liparis tanakae TaxID=230148 RepID=A0A4Z2GXG3_9TELE|nr:hypothetical protein EYF80_031576 [Liparis tanakae]
MICLGERCGVWMGMDSPCEPVESLTWFPSPYGAVFIPVERLPLPPDARPAETPIVAVWGEAGRSDVKEALGAEALPSLAASSLGSNADSHPIPSSTDISIWLRVSSVGFNLPSSGV